MRFLVALAFLATVYCSSPDECAWGESYWCSTISNAKKCGAFQHCLDTVWTNEKVEKDDTDVCKFCESIIQDVRNFVDDKDNQDQVKQFLDNACNIIPDEELAKLCTTAVTDDIDELVKMIDSELDAATICSAIGLCSGFKDLAKHSTLEVSSKVESNICEFCEAVIKDTRAFVDDKDNQEQLKTLLDNLCNVIPDQEIAKLCKTTFNDEFDQLIQMIDTLLDPATVCKNLQLCTAEMKMKAIKSDNCGECKDFFLVTAQMFADKNWQKQTAEIVKLNICTKMSNWEETCDMVVDMELPNAMAELSSLMTEYGPLVCTYTGFCSNNLQSSLIQLPNELCQDCQSFFQRMSKMLADEGLQKRITAIVNRACDFTEHSWVETKFKEACNYVVTSDVPAAMNSLSWELANHGNQICSDVNFCPKQVTADHHLVNAIKQSTSVKAGSAEECLLCKTVIGELQNFDRDAATQKEVEDFLKQKFCAQLGTLQTVCENLVDEYAPELFDLLVKELDPETTCTELGFCASQNLQSILRAAVPVNKPRSGPPKKAASVSDPSTTCLLCEFVIRTIDNEIGDNATEAEIIAALDKVCDDLPDTLKDTCTTFVNQYGPTVIALLLQELDPTQVCDKLGLCQSAMVKPVEKVKATPQCTLCEFVMTELDQILGDNATESEIIAALDKVCSIMPSSVEKDCMDFVNTYGRAVIELLAQELQPQQVCMILGLCGGQRAKPMLFAKAKVSDEELCGVCETVIQYLDSLVEENDTIAEIEAVLDKVCNFLPDTMKSQCDDFVKTYGPAVIEMLAQYLDPREICTDVGLCSNKAAAKQKQQEKQEEESNNIEPVIVPQKVPLLGEDDCTMGPAFWCLNMNNALQCNAVEHCKLKVWN